MMMIGLFGMSYFSSQSNDNDKAHSSLELVQSYIDQGTKIEEKTYVDSSCEHANRKILKSSSDDDSGQIDYEMITMCNVKLSKRTFGLSFAVFNGLWGGSVLIPMHYTK